MKQLYSVETAEKKEKSLKYLIILTVAVAVAAVASCLIICLNVTTANAFIMEIAAMIITIVAGWAVIFLLTNFVLYNKYLVMHYDNILTIERNRVVGELVVTKYKAKLGEVTAYMAQIKTGDNELIEALIFEGHYYELKKIKGRRVYEMAYNFITAYGEDCL